MKQHHPDIGAFSCRKKPQWKLGEIGILENSALLSPIGYACMFKHEGSMDWLDRRSVEWKNEMSVLRSVVALRSHKCDNGEGIIMVD